MITRTQGSTSGFTQPFCCWDPNITRERCNNATDGSEVPFRIPSAEIIFDRSSGARIQNGTLSSVDSTITTTTSIVTLRTQSTTLSPSLATLSTNTAIVASNYTHCDQSEKLAIGAGIGIPMLAALCAALVAFYFQRRQTRNFRQELEESVKDNHVQRVASTVGTVRADTSTRQELDEIHVNEVDDRARHYEMGS